MPRRRSISPEFFKDEDLTTLPFDVRLLFQGLWCYADREGRLEDRPKYLKSELFPYDKVDVAKGLSLLASPQIPDRPQKAFIRRYAVNGRQYIEIIEFGKHQTPHCHEAESRYPAWNPDLPGNVSASTDMLVQAPTEIPCQYIETRDQLQDQKPETRRAKKLKSQKTTIPDDFTISPAVAAWAKREGFSKLDQRLEHFKDLAIAKGYTYIDWDAAFRNAIRDDWAKLGGPTQPTLATTHPSQAPHPQVSARQKYLLRITQEQFKEQAEREAAAKGPA